MKKQPPSLKQGSWFYLSDWPDEFPTQGQFRKWLLNSKQNGFERCFRRVGLGKRKRIVVNREAVLQWLEESEE